MIDIKELRIGSWVHYKNPLYKKGFYQVCGINNNSTPIGENITVDLDSQSLDTHVHRASLKDILPIHLKEEILLKCGFVQKGSLFGIGFLDTIYWYNRENHILYIEYTDSPFVEDEGMRYPVSSPIKHLHVLMNIIYDLTGEELEVKL